MMVHLCSFSDPVDYRITDGERVWYFDWSDRFGPTRLRQDGEPCSKPFPPETSPYWRCVMLWKRQGKRAEPIAGREDMLQALWDEPPPGTYVLDERGMILSHDEPEGFDPDYSVAVYLDQHGNPARFRKPRRRRQQLRIWIA